MISPRDDMVHLKRMPPGHHAHLQPRAADRHAKERLWAGDLFAGILLTIILATFGARYYWDGQCLGPRHDGPGRDPGVPLDRGPHAIVIFGVYSARAAPSIAGEKDRRTLDFLLATRLSNAEIVLGKLAACMRLPRARFAVGLADHAALESAGGHRSPADLLAYAGLMHHGVFHDRAGHLGLDRRAQRPRSPPASRSSGRSPG